MRARGVRENERLSAITALVTLARRHFRSHPRIPSSLQPHSLKNTPGPSFPNTPVKAKMQTPSEIATERFVEISFAIAEGTSHSSFRSLQTRCSIAPPALSRWIPLQRLCPISSQKHSGALPRTPFRLCIHSEPLFLCSAHLRFFCSSRLSGCRARVWLPFSP